MNNQRYLIIRDLVYDKQEPNSIETELLVEVTRLRNAISQISKHCDFSIKHPILKGVLSVRTFNGIQSVSPPLEFYEDLAEFGKRNLLKIRNLGLKSVYEIQDILHEMHLELKK
jgi:DNA-directed RNA polymerase alpha subunit